MPVFHLRVHSRLLLSLFVALATGCGGSPDKVEVSGKVQYKGGKPLDGAIQYIRFEPAMDTTAEVRKAASSEIEPDGSFNLYTRKPGDGAFLGKYVVTFTVLKSIGGPSLIKTEYTLANESPYTVEVTDDMSELVYELEPK